MEALEQNGKTRRKQFENLSEQDSAKTTFDCSTALRVDRTATTNPLDTVRGRVPAMQEAESGVSVRAARTQKLSRRIIPATFL